MKLLPYNTVLQLIEEGGYGTYRLYAIPGGDMLGGSHLTDEKDKSMTAGDLVQHLQNKIELMGDGTYRIVLKKSNMTPNTAEVRYSFSVDNGGSQAGHTDTRGYAGLGGLGAEQVETIVSKRVDEALRYERQKHELEMKMKDLDNQIKELNRSRRRPAAKTNTWLAGLMDLGKIGAVTLIAEKFPNSMPAVKELLATMQAPDEEEDEDEGQGTGFSRPEE